MSKTNFKCMFLIDDKLYNKTILQEGSTDNTNTRVPIPNSTYLASIPSSMQLITDKPVANMTSPIRSNSSGEFREIIDTAKVDNGQQVKVALSDKDQQTEIPVPSASSANITASEKLGDIQNMEIDKSMNEKEDCECNDTLPKASSSQKKTGIKRKSEFIANENMMKGRRLKESKKSSQKRQNDKGKAKQKKKRLTTNRPLSAHAKSKLDNEDDNLSDDSDWEELKQRYRRLRGDFDSPPREENINLHSDHAKSKLDNEDDNLSDDSDWEELKQRYRRLRGDFDSPPREENINLHSEYLNKQNKRKRNIPQNQTQQKIRRAEFLCVFCQKFFKTTSALERHNLNIHGMDRGSKRTNDRNEARYVKRQKIHDKPAVTYLNYF